MLDRLITDRRGRWIEGVLGGGIDGAPGKELVDGILLVVAGPCGEVGVEENDERRGSGKIEHPRSSATT